MSHRLPAALLVAVITLSAQTVEVRDASTIYMPGQVDCNSPAFWRDGELFLFNSTGAGPILSRGFDQLSLVMEDRVQLSGKPIGPRWIEAVWQEPDGPLYAWYHEEHENVCGAQRPAQPHIGALISYDGGYSFTDLGIVLRSPDPPDCSSQNGYISGGHGDFSVVLDREAGYFYFLFSTYGGPDVNQGVSVARMAFADRSRPVGQVWKYADGEWNQPGVGGRGTPIFPATKNWQVPDTDSFWGPSVHYNTFLNTWVMLLNRSCCSPGYPQEGIYISFNPDLANPQEWSAPAKILDGTWWYPQVLGLGPGETDSLAGETARLYVYGSSRWELIFKKPESEPPAPIEEPAEP